MDKMIEAAARAYSGAPFPSARSVNAMRKALETLGVPLDTIVALREGRVRAVEVPGCVGVPHPTSACSYDIEWIKRFRTATGASLAGAVIEHQRLVSAGGRR